MTRARGSRLICKCALDLDVLINGQTNCKPGPGVTLLIIQMQRNRLQVCLLLSSNASSHRKRVPRRFEDGYFEFVCAVCSAESEEGRLPQQLEFCFVKF